MKPNVFEIGINLNEILADMIERLEEQSKQGELRKQ